MRDRCHGAVTPGSVVKPLQHSLWEGCSTSTCTASFVCPSPSIALSWEFNLSDCILRRFDLLTMVSCPYCGCFLVQRFPAHPLHVPLRAHRFAQGLFASPPASPVG